MQYAKYGVIEEQDEPETPAPPQSNLPTSIPTVSPPAPMPPSKPPLSAAPPPGPPASPVGATPTPEPVAPAGMIPPQGGDGMGLIKQSLMGPQQPPEESGMQQMIAEALARRK